MGVAGELVVYPDPQGVNHFAWRDFVSLQGDASHLEGVGSCGIGGDLVHQLSFGW